MGGSTPARLLIAGRFAIGGASFVAPVLSLGIGGLRPRENPQAAYMLRLFAVRDVMLGVGPLASTGAARRTWWKLGIACDLADSLDGLRSSRDGDVPRTPLATAMLVASPLLGAALGAAALAADGG